MSISVRDGGVWKNGTPYVRDGGVWKPVQVGYVRDAGTWKEFYSGYSLPEFRSNSNNYNTGGTSVSVNKPSGVIEGDILLGFVSALYTLGTPTITLPSGWTELATVSQGFAGRSTIAWKIAGGSEPGSYSFSTSNGYIMASVSAYTGGNGDAQAGAYSNVTSTTSTAPSINIAETEAKLIGFWTFLDDRSINTPPSGMTQRFLYDVNVSTAGFSQTSFDETVGTGATGDRTLVWSGSGGPRAWSVLVALS